MWGGADKITAKPGGALQERTTLPDLTQIVEADVPNSSVTPVASRGPLLVATTQKSLVEGRR